MKEGLSDLIDDVLGEVFSRLPEKSFFGENNIRYVCHRFNNINKARKPVTKLQILNQCRSKQDSIELLRDKQFRETLKFEEWLRIVSFNDEVVEAIFDSLTEEERLMICKHNTSLALYVFNDPNLNKLINKFKLAKNHVEIAMAIYNNPATMMGVLPINLFYLAHHPSLFQLIKLKPKLMHLLAFYIPHLVDVHSEAARWVIHSPFVLMDILLFDEVARYEDLCHEMLDNNYLHPYFPIQSLVSLGKVHLSVVQRIARTAKFSDLLDASHKSDLIKYHPVLSDEFPDWIQIPDINKNTISGDNLMKMALNSKQAGLSILADTVRLQKLTKSEIVLLVQHCIEYAKAAIDYAKQQDEVSLMVLLCETYPAILETIGQDKEYLESLDPLNRLSKKLDIITSIIEIIQKQENEQKRAFNFR